MLSSRGASRAQGRWCVDRDLGHRFGLLCTTAVAYIVRCDTRDTELRTNDRVAQHVTRGGVSRPVFWIWFRALTIFDGRSQLITYPDMGETKVTSPIEMLRLAHPHQLPRVVAICASKQGGLKKARELYEEARGALFGRPPPLPTSLFACETGENIHAGENAQSRRKHTRAGDGESS